MLRDLEAFLRYVTLIAVRLYLLTYLRCTCIREGISNQLNPLILLLSATQDISDL